MTLKHLLVHLDAGERAPERLDLAVTLARKSGARLTGLFAESESFGRSIVGRRSRDQVLRAATETRTAFDAKTSAAGLATDWWQLDPGDYGHVVGWTVVCCRYVDLAVFGQHDTGNVRVPEDIVEQVLLNSGRPVLVVPFVGSHAEIGKRVLVAWTGSREAARAINDALPLMQGADTVHVLGFQQPRADATGGPVPPVDIVSHLKAHGIAAQYERVLVDDFGVVDTLLNRAFDLQSDLIVAGGYGLDGLPFMQRGSNTRKLLQTMTVPVLLSH